VYAVMQKLGKKTRDTIAYDYTFKDFKSFYEIAQILTYKLVGRFQIKIETDRVADVEEFIRKEKDFKTLDIYIHMPEASLDILLQRNTNVHVRDKVKMFEVFKELVSEQKILFDRGAIYTLYNSIPHETDAMEAALKQISREYPSGTKVTENMLSKLFILNKVVYPRSVLVSFIYMERYRWSKLQKSVEMLGNDVVVGAMVKNIKQFIKDKATYYRTGQASTFIKSLNTDNLLLMYRVLVSERKGLDDAALLLTLYERGMSTHDFVQQ